MKDPTSILMQSLRVDLLNGYRATVVNHDTSSCCIKWLSQRLVPSLSVQGLMFPGDQILKRSIEATGANLTFNGVAQLGYLSQIVSLSEENKSKVSEALEWISSRSAYEGSLPPTFEVSGQAILGFAVGAASCREEVQRKVARWIEGFIERSISNERLDPYERALMASALHVIGSKMDVSKNLQSLTADSKLLVEVISAKSPTPEAQASAIRCLLTRIPQDATSFTDAIGFVLLQWSGVNVPLVQFKERSAQAVLELLSSAHKSFKRWPWNNGGSDVHWEMPDEYHVQSYLWSLLAPIFPDLEDEEYLTSLGFKHPRVDLCIPSLRLVIEVKYARTGTNSELASLTEEIAADASLYLKAGSNFEFVIPFIWDNSRRSEQHPELISGLQEIKGVIGAVVVSRPGKMQHEIPKAKVANGRSKTTKKTQAKKVVQGKKAPAKRKSPKRKK